MQKIIYKLVQKIMELQVFFHERHVANLYKSITKGSKNLLLDGVDVDFNVKIETKKLELEEKLCKIIKDCNSNGEKILDFIKEDGVDVFRINNAKNLLKFIDEEEGFIPPLVGINAFLLNLFINLIVYKKFIISFKSNEMFIYNSAQIDIYDVIHQLYLCYAYKVGLSGYDFKNRRKIKRLIDSIRESDISSLSVEEIVNMKFMIARDKDAIDFVTKIAKESEASTKLLNKIKDGESVKL